MRRLLPFLALGCALAACAAPDSRVRQLEQQLRERNADITELRRQLGTAQEAKPSPAPQESPAPSGVAEDETGALERALVLQGGSVIPQGAIEIEPEFDYFYSEPSSGGRRDTVVSALTLRLGLPWAAQADVRVPYVAYDRQTGFPSVSGLGDIQLGLTKQLIAEREFVPELLFAGRWKTTTGRTGTILPTGTGADSLQAVLTAVKRQDPIVLFGSLSYIASLGTGRADLGDMAGGRFGTFLAATPDTSVFLDVDVNSTFADRVGVIGSNRLVGVVETGAATVLSRATLLNITAGVGFTSAAPDFRLTVSLPTRF